MSGGRAEPAVTVRLRLEIAYDGSDFAGWAVQPGRRTVAGVLGEALAVLFRAPVPMVVAGRTDAGVHAIGQVAHIDVDPGALAALAPRHLPPALCAPGGAMPPPGAHKAGDAAADLGPGLIGLRRRLAGLLAPDVRVRAVRVAPDGFDARFSALRRHYRYRIADTDWGADPLRRTDTLPWRRRLDVDAMQRAANLLTGLRDFAAYCRPREGATTIRDLQRIAVTGRRDGIVVIHVTADAFCHSMVRSLVGALLAVGDGRFAVDRPAALLAASRRTSEIAVAPAQGLTLVGVDYPADADLGARATHTRALRTGTADSPGAATGTDAAEGVHGAVHSAARSL